MWLQVPLSSLQAHIMKTLFREGGKGLATASWFHGRPQLRVIGTGKVPTVWSASRWCCTYDLLLTTYYLLGGINNVGVWR